MLIGLYNVLHIYITALFVCGINRDLNIEMKALL